MKKNEIIDEARRVFNVEIDALEKVRDDIDEKFTDIIMLITNCSGKVILTGMGKSGHIGKKIAATMSSLGIAAFFIHSVEALHGDLGMIQANDVIIAISYSGESEEITKILPSIKLIGSKLVGITGNSSSVLAHYSDIVYTLPKFHEACNMNLAPTSSTTAALVIGDALAICASQNLGFNKENFAFFHPSGSLGKKLLTKVSDLMHFGIGNSTIGKLATLKEAIVEMSLKSLGLVNVIDENNELLGIYTDGDLRRTLSNEIDIYSIRISNVMKLNPICIESSELAINALKIMKEKNISVIPVVENGKLVGTIRTNDILKAGIVI